MTDLPAARTTSLPLPWATDSYSTPPAAAFALAGSVPNLYFYMRMLGTVGFAGIKAYLGRYFGKDWIGSSIAIFRHLERCGTSIDITGMDNVRKLAGPAIFIANHMSTLETFVLPCLIQSIREVTFVVKDSLLKYPFFGPVLKSRDPIVVTRKNLRADLSAMLDGGAERLAAGRSIIIFPQGTRYLRINPHHFNSIGVKLARKTGVPIIPVALRTDAWGTGKRVKDFGPVNPALPVHFRFGEAITVEGNGKAEHAQIYAFIRDALEEWGLPEETTENAAEQADSAV